MTVEFEIDDPGDKEIQVLYDKKNIACVYSKKPGLFEGVISNMPGEQKCHCDGYQEFMGCKCCAKD